MKKYINLNTTCFLFTFTLVFIILFIQLDRYSLRLWDESRLASNAYEMYFNKQYIVTYFEDKPDMWNTKPPLFIWLQVISMHIFGINTFATRFPAALAGFTTCLIIWFFLKHNFKNVIYASLSVIILITSLGYIGYHGTRSGDYDSLVAMWLTSGSLLLYIYLTNWQPKYLYLFFLAIVGAVLTKSVVGFMFGPAWLGYVIYKKSLFKLLKEKHFWIGLIIMLLLIGSYYITREYLNPGYVKDVINNEYSGRYLHTLEGHKNSIYYYLINIKDTRFKYWLVLGLLAFFSIFFLPNGKRKDILVLMSLNVVFFLIIICISKSKLEWYDLPIYPSLAILTASLVLLIPKHTYKTLKHKIILSTALLCLIFIPIVDSFNTTVLYKEDATLKSDFIYGNYLQDVSKGNLPLLGFKYVYHDYLPNERFYINIINFDKERIININSEQIKIGDTILANSSNIEKIIQSKFQVLRLPEQYGVARNVIQGLK